MNAIWNFIMQHQVTFSLGAAYVWSAVISALPAPTGASSMFYQFVFKFLNVLAANITRSYKTAVENSPNFQGAVDRQTTMAGLPSIDTKTNGGNGKAN